MKNEIQTIPPEELNEINKIERKETEAVDKFKEQAEKTLSIIQENHFHLRLWKAVGGKD